MPCSADSIVLQATRRLALGNPDFENYEIDVAACLPAALDKLALEVMRDDAQRGLLQQSYSVTLDSSGAGNLLTTTGAITGVADILSEGVYYGVVKDADGDILQPLKSYGAFLRPQPLVFSYYCLSGQRILTRAKSVQVNTPADVTSVNGPLTVYASFEPSLVSHVPDELEGQLVNCVVFYALVKLQEYRERQAKK